jgi:hypothetical protein
MKSGGPDMIKAVVANGVIVPRDPLPADWAEGTELAVEKIHRDDSTDNGPHSTDAWMDEVEAIALRGDRKDDQRLENAILEVRHREKALARKRLGTNP